MLSHVYAKHITPILNVSDIAASVAWFERLGWKRCWEWKDEGSPVATFASVGSGECEIFLCLNRQGGRGRSALEATGGRTGPDDPESGVWMTVWVEDVDSVHARCVKEGLEVARGPVDEPWGVREFHLRHPDGHVMRISRGLHVEKDKRSVEGFGELLA